MDHSNLYDLITYLEYGTKLHIGVIFLGKYGNEKLNISKNHFIHASDVCWEMKNRPGGFDRCFACRTAAIDKAISEKEPWGGFCTNGVYEYTHPVVIDGQVAAVIYVGNILTDGEGRKRLDRRLIDKKELYDTMEKDFSEEQCRALSSIIESYIRLIFDTYGTEYSDSRIDARVQNIKNFIKENIESEISISHLAKHFNYNEKYLGRIFKQKTGISIRQYISNQRISLAKRLLENGDLVINVANSVGFSNVTYFNYLFKQIVGQTPTEYRENSKKTN